MGGSVRIASLVYDDGLGSRAAGVHARGRHAAALLAPPLQGRRDAARLDIVKGLGDAWLNHCQRRTYDRIALIPERPVPGRCLQPVARLGRRSPRPARGPRSRRICATVVCSGREDHYRLADRLAGLLRPASRPAGRGRRRPPRPEGHRQGHGRPDADADLPATTACTSPTASTWSATSMPIWSTRCSCSWTRRSGPATSRARARSRR